METDVVVIGGGLAGLACGLELSRSGLKVTLLESSPDLGGRARSWKDSRTGDWIDIGPHILLTEYRNMLHLLQDLETADQVVWQTGKFITLIDKPHPVDIRMHDLPAPFHFLPSLLALPQVSLADLASNRRVMWQVVRLTDTRMAQLDSIGAEDYLRRMHVSDRFIEWFWRSACMSVMNTPLEKCSAGALLRFFRFMIGKSGYQVGFAGTALSNLFAPAAARRIEAGGGRVLKNTRAVKIHSGDSAVSVEVAEGSPVQARLCVAAVPPQELLRLLPESVQHQEMFSALGKFEPSPYVSSYLWFDRKLTQERFWARVWAPENLNYDSYDLSNIRPGWGDRPSLIASNIVYSYRTDGMSDEDIIAATLDELTEFLPEVTQATLQHARVHHIPMAVPLPSPGSEHLRPPTQTPLVNLLLAGDWTATGLPASMEGAVRSGYLAAEKALARFQRPRQIALPIPVAEGLVRLIGG